MRFAPKAIGLALLVMFTALGMAQDAKVIKRTAKEGDVLRFRMRAEADLEGKRAVFTALIVETVKKIEENGVLTLEALSTENKVDFNGNSVEPADNVTTTLVKDTGEIVAIVTEADDPNLYRLAQFNSLRFPSTPLKTGDTWTVEIPKDDRGAVAANGSYKVEAVEKVLDIDTYRVTGSLKEIDGSQPASMTGTFWVSVADGSIVKMEGTLINAPFPNLPPLTMKITLVREKQEGIKN